MPRIAVDGPAASGKGTIARELARHFAIPHLDTGALYRATALAASRAGIAATDADRCAAMAASFDAALLTDPAIRSDATGQLAAEIATIPAVRAALLQRQRDFAAQPGGAVLDGRDIGTVIVPDADAKLFVTARPEIRAHRRFAELAAAGAAVTESQVLASIRARDATDSGRIAAPLRQAVDADLLDTSDLGIKAAVQRAVQLVLRRLNQAS